MESGTTGGSTGGTMDSTTRGTMDSDMRESRDSATGGETGTVVQGWSAKKSIIGKAVTNEANEKIGKVEDIIVTPEDSVSKAIIGVGGFLGMGEHRVAVP
ncbi:MAG: PRC-barrel domain containing protein, partial [Geobacter sp.]